MQICVWDKFDKSIFCKGRKFAKKMLFRQRRFAKKTFYKADKFTKIGGDIFRGAATNKLEQIPRKEHKIMREYRVPLDDAAALFYEQVAKKAHMPPERIMATALFKVAGKISAEAISARNEK